MASVRGWRWRLGRLVLLAFLGMSMPPPAVGAGDPEGGDPVACRHEAIKRHYLDADWDGFLEQYRGLPLNECPHVHYLLARSLLSRQQLLDLIGYVRYFGVSSEQRGEWSPPGLFRDLLSQAGYSPVEVDDQLAVVKGFASLSHLGAALMSKLAEKGYSAANYEMHPSIMTVIFGAQDMSHGSGPGDSVRERFGHGVHAGSLHAARLVVMIVAAESWLGPNDVPKAAENLLLDHAAHGFSDAAVWLTEAYERGAFGGSGTDKARRMSEIASTRLHWPLGSPIPLPSGMMLERLQQIGESVVLILRESQWSDTDHPVYGSRLCDPSDTRCVVRLMNSFSNCQMWNMALIERAEILASELHNRCVVNGMALYRSTFREYVPHRIAPILPRLPHERDMIR